jgi:hypothetical protein
MQRIVILKHLMVFQLPADCEQGKDMTEKFGEAALRHLTDGEMLADGERWGGAGHLIDFAAECAIKHRIKTVLPKEDAPGGHFPKLIDIAKRHLTGRSHLALSAVLKRKRGKLPGKPIEVDRRAQATPP